MDQSRFRVFHIQNWNDVAMLESIKKILLMVVLLALLVSSGACTTAEYHLSLSLSISVVSKGIVPLEGLEVWLIDREFPIDAQPKRLLGSICTTNKAGQCSVSVEYQYGRTSTVTIERLREWWMGKHRFELQIRTNTRVVSKLMLPPLSSKQIYGFEEIKCQLEIEPDEETNS
jgi:hypothetical protein